MSTKAIVILTVVILLTSCDPYHSLVVENRSAANKHIQVVLPRKEYFTPPDSVRLAKTTTQSQHGYELLERIAVQDRDAAINRYSFVLPSGRRALLEGGFGIRPITELIIINRADTVKVNERRGRVHKVKPKVLMGGTYKLVINQ